MVCSVVVEVPSAPRPRAVTRYTVTGGDAGFSDVTEMSSPTAATDGRFSMTNFGAREAVGTAVSGGPAYVSAVFQSRLVTGLPFDNSGANRPFALAAKLVYRPVSNPVSAPR